MKIVTPFILLITGFGQLENRLNGLRELQEKLWAFMPRNRVLRVKHHANARELAAIVRNAWAKEPVTTPVYIAGHSMGGKKGRSVAVELKQTGVPVEGLWLTDAFGERRGREPIIIPANVKEAWAYISTENWIEGSEVRCESGATILHTFPPFDVPHAKMSQLPALHQSVIAKLKAA